MSMVDEVEDERVSLLARKLDQFVKKMKCSGATGVGIETFKDIKGRKTTENGCTKPVEIVFSSGNQS